MSILFENPAAGAAQFGELGGAATYLALAIAMAAIAWHLARQPQQLAWLGLALPIIVAPLAAATVTRIVQVTDPWLGYHTLTGIWYVCGLAAALLLTWRTWKGEVTRWCQSLRWVAALMPLAVLVLLFRGYEGDPSSPELDDRVAVGDLRALDRDGIDGAFAMVCARVDLGGSVGRVGVLGRTRSAVALSIRCWTVSF